MIPARLSFVTLGARDLPAQRAFYKRLGWDEAISVDNFAAFNTGGAVLGLFPMDELVKDAQVAEPTDTSSFRGVTMAINVDGPQRVDEALAAAKEAGAAILKDAVDAEWGGRSGYFADPEGNVWEVAWMPDSSFDERGGLILPPPS